MATRVLPVTVVLQLRASHAINQPWVRRLWRALTCCRWCPCSDPSALYHSSPSGLKHILKQFEHSRLCKQPVAVLGAALTHFFFADNLVPLCVVTGRRVWTLSPGLRLPVPHCFWVRFYVVCFLSLRSRTPVNATIWMFDIMEWQWVQVGGVLVVLCLIWQSHSIFINQLLGLWCIKSFCSGGKNP